MAETTGQGHDHTPRDTRVALGWLDPAHIVRSIVLSLMDSADHVAEWLTRRASDEATPKRN